MNLKKKKESLILKDKEILNLLNVISNKINNEDFNQDELDIEKILMIYKSIIPLHIKEKNDFIEIMVSLGKIENTKFIKYDTLTNISDSFWEFLMKLQQN